MDTTQLKAIEAAKAGVLNLHGKLAQGIVPKYEDVDAINNALAAIETDATAKHQLLERSLAVLEDAEWSEHDAVPDQCPICRGQDTNGTGHHDGCELEALCNDLNQVVHPDTCGDRTPSPACTVTTTVEHTVTEYGPDGKPVDR